MDYESISTEISYFTIVQMEILCICTNEKYLSIQIEGSFALQESIFHFFT